MNIEEIETIKKCTIARMETMKTRCLEYHRGEEAVSDCLKLLTHIDELESRFRWRKVDGDRPSVNKVVLIRTNETADPITGRYFPRYNGATSYCWVTPNGRHELSIFPEWREI